MAFNTFMHHKNIYKTPQNFEQIALDYPEFRKYIVRNERGKPRIDFSNTDALRSFTEILLRKDFDLNIEIPKGFLIPTVPQRLNYILWIDDLLSLLSNKDSQVKGIDIGTGPCAIFSVLGAVKYGWSFISTESSFEAIQWAQKNIESNNLKSLIEVIKVDKDSFLEDVVSSNNITYDFCLCNPPFFGNTEEIRKKHPRASETIADVAKTSEILAEGGEAKFVKRIIEDSIIYKKRVRFYTSMFGKKKNFIQILKELSNIKGVKYTKTEFCQGNTIRWGVAWTFLDDIDFGKIERAKQKKIKKTKPPLIHQIARNSKEITIQVILEKLKMYLLNIQVQLKIQKCAENYAEIQIAAEKNTWSHQRRKRREQVKGKICMMPTENFDASESNANNFAFDVSKTRVDNVTSESVKCVSSCEVSTLCNDKSALEHNILADSSYSSEKFIPKSEHLHSDNIHGSTKMIKRKIECDIESSKKIKLEVLTNKVEDEECVKFDSESLLFSTIKLRKEKEYIALEINCLPTSNRDSMYQIFQYLKNKFD